uniref:PAM2 domain-containing protein n=1 Tax=Loa loa TaxID=7209 RepID=A0A1I7VSH4_LOALO
MTEIGEEITLLPYDYDIADDGGGEKAKESETKADDAIGTVEKSTENTDQVKSDAEGDLLPDDQTQDSNNFPALPADESGGVRGDFDNGYGEQAELYEHDVPPPPPAVQQSEPIEPEEPRQPEKSKTPPVLPHPQSNFLKANINQPYPVHPYQPQPHSELPEPYQSQPPVGSEACQIIATGMNTEMQQFASLLASQALAQVSPPSTFQIPKSRDGYCASYHDEFRAAIWTTVVLRCQ